MRYCKDIVGDHGAKINATDVLQLPRYDGNINSTLDILDAAGLLIDDRPPTLSGASPARPMACRTR